MNASRILIVEDERIVAANLRQRLEGLGYQPVGMAADGLTAISLANQLRPDLVLMDIQLEGEMDGITAAQEIRQKLHIPSLILSAFSEDAVLERAKLAEPLAYILKPFELRELKANIEMALYKARVDEESRNAKSRLEEILNNLDGLVYVSDMQTYETVFVNQYGKNLWGDFTGKRCWQNLQSGQTGPCSFCTNALLLRPDGSPAGVHVWEWKNTVTNRWYECRDSAIRWPDGRLVRLEVATDITGRKRLEAHARQTQKLEAVGHLAGGIAHEFNNILAGIMMSLDCVKLHSPEPESRHTIDGIQTLAQRAAKLVRQLLAFSRQSPIQCQPLNLVEVVSNQYKLLAGLLGEKIRFDFSVVGDAIWVNADKSSLEQVLLNLCVNACDAMTNGGNLRLTLQSAVVNEETAALHPEVKAGEFACLAVSDSGCGMSPETLQRLFEPFFTTKEVGHGPGLGLATVRGLIEQQHGWVEAESRLGEGSLFRVYLPRITPLPKAIIERPAETGVAWGEGTILLVEDEPFLRQLEARFLSHSGYQVLSASDSSGALDIWQREMAGIDLLFTDMILPGNCSGLQLAKLLLADKPDLKVIITSGYVSDASEPEENTDEPIVFLSKPCPAGTLTRVIQKCLLRR